MLAPFTRTFAPPLVGLVSLISSYLLDDEFSVDDNNPMTTPRACEPGPGSLVITDTGGKLSIASGKLTWTTKTVDNTDPRAISSVTVARATGLAIHSYFNSAKILFGFDAANTQSPQVNSYNLSSTSIIFQVATGNLQVNLADVRVTVDYYNFIIVLQSDGTYWFIKNPTGSDYPYWELLYFSRANATANLYLGIGSSNGSPTSLGIEDIRLANLGGGFETDYGIATSYTASASASATGLMSANGLVICSRTFVTSDVFELDVRRTDNDNRVIIRCDQAGSTIKIIERAAGVETEKASSAQTWSNGTAYRISVRCVDYKITPVVNDIVKTAWSAAIFNALETGMKVSHAVTKWAAFPRTLGGAPAVWLSALAGLSAGSDPVLGTGVYPAQDYIDRVMALSPFAYCPMQEAYGNNLLDVTGNARGAVSTGVYPGQNGMYGTSYQLVGTSVSNWSYNNAFRTAFDINEFSVACWAYIPTVGSPPVAMRLANCYSGPGGAQTEYVAYEIRSGNQGSIYLKDTAAALQTISYTDLGGAFPRDRWVHLVVYNSLSLDVAGVYIDGVNYEVDRTVGVMSGTNSLLYPQIHDVLGYMQHQAWFTGKLAQAAVDTICT